MKLVVLLIKTTENRLSIEIFIQLIVVFANEYYTLFRQNVSLQVFNLIIFCLTSIFSDTTWKETY